MRIVRDADVLMKLCRTWHQEGQTIGFVPTMGALHEGHLSLCKKAQQHNTITIASIFINPLQFAAHEDFSTYPRQEENDIHHLQKNPLDIIYLPDPSQFYGKRFSTTIDPGPLGKELEGRDRPHFFSGVCTVVTKFLLQTSAHNAYFGEKDYQQFRIIEKITKELDIPTEIIGCPIIREKDGLATSSRNRYLSKKERAIAPQLYQTLQTLKTRIHQQHALKSALSEAQEALLDYGFTKIRYLELRHSYTLESVSGEPSHPTHLLAAVYLGNTRLIDNIKIW